jgi:hypothetical protein
MNQTELMNIKITEAKKSNQWVDLEVHNKYLGKTSIHMNCLLKDAIEVIEKGWSDNVSESVDSERLKRTGVEMPEGGDIPDDANFILLDWIRGLDYGNDSCKVTPSQIEEYSYYKYGKQIG